MGNGLMLMVAFWLAAGLIVFGATVISLYLVFEQQDIAVILLTVTIAYALVHGGKWVLR